MTLIPGARESEGCYLGLWEVFGKYKRIMQSLEKNNKVNNQCFESDYVFFVGGVGITKKLNNSKEYVVIELENVVC